MHPKDWVWQAMDEGERRLYTACDYDALFDALVSAVEEEEVGETEGDRNRAWHERMIISRVLWEKGWWEYADNGLRTLQD